MYDSSVTSSVADEEVLLNSTHHILNHDDLTDLGKIITTYHKTNITYQLNLHQLVRDLKYYKLVHKLLPSDPICLAPLANSGT